MAYLWVVLAGAIVFVGASFLPWIAVAFAGLGPVNFSFWEWALFMTHGVKQLDLEAVLNASLWLLPFCVAGILVLDLIQLLRRRINKALTTWMFILSLVCLVPLVWSLFFFESYFESRREKAVLEFILAAPHIGYLLTFVGFLTIIVGSAIGFFSKKRGLNKA